MATPIVGAPPKKPELNAEADAGQDRYSQDVAGKSEDSTTDAPKKAKVMAPDEVTCTPEEQQQILGLIRRYTDRWSPVRRRRVRQVLRAREYFKNNQYISFNNDNFSWFDPLEALFDGDPQKQDLGVYRYINNIYQMLALSFVAALSPQVPKTQYMPADAEKLEDTATAKAASTLQQIIERQNKIKNIQKMELLYLWTDGCYYSYTRFLVDSNRAGTHREPTWGEEDQQVMPDRYECPECGVSTPAANMSMVAPYCDGDGDEDGCGAMLSPSNFYPSESDLMPKIASYKDVPNGMVTISTYGLLNVIAAPYAIELWQTPMLRLDEEVDLASIRSSYPDHWNDIKGTETSTAETETERLARQQVLNMVGGRNNMTSESMPTYSRTWLQSWAFNAIEDQTTALALIAKFPEGCLVVHVADVFLEARKSQIRDHWTWCGMVKGFGLNPPGIGDVVLDVQDRVNDSGNTLAEHMDRAACPPLLVDGSAIDTRKLNNAPMLAGVMKEVPRKATGGNRPLKDFLFQPTITVDNHIYDHIDRLVLFAQLVSGVLPQIFGGSDKNVQTASGQKQMLNTALGRLGLFWDNIREEHAEKSAICIRCAAKNYTDDILNVVGGGGSDYRNEYVRINDLSGEFHAYPETDQGFPQTYAEIQSRLQEMFADAGDNPLFMELMDEPVNQKQFANYMLPANFVIPGEADRNKCIRTINELMRTKPKMMGQLQLPSIMVDEDYDKTDVIKKVVRQWAIENYDQRLENSDGWTNVLLYFRMASEVEADKMMQDQARAALTAGVPPGGGNSKVAPPTSPEPAGAPAQ